MDDRVARLKSPEDCEKFARNVMANYPELASQARRRAVELRAEAYGGTSPVEKEALRAVYAYEEVLTKKNGRRTHATRTWQMIKKYGVIEAVERAVNRESDAAGFTSLAEMEMLDLAFESVVLRHPEAFTAGTQERARQRLEL